MKTAENMALPENKWEGFPLSFQQKQLIKQNTRNSPQYFSATYSLSGSLDTQRLIAALSALIHEHEILRTSFRNVLGENSDVLMVINEPYKPELVMAEGEPSDAGEFNEEKTGLACGGPSLQNGLSTLHFTASLTTSILWLLQCPQPAWTTFPLMR